MARKRTGLNPTLELPMRGGARFGAVAPIIYLKDLYTGAAGTNLAAHVMDVGPGWTNRVGTWQIGAANFAVTSTGGNGDIADSDAGHADCTYTQDMMPVNVAPNTRYVGAILRLSDALNFWLAQIDQDANQLQLYDCQAGAFTLRASAAQAVVTGVYHEVKAVLLGNNYQCSYDGALLINFNSGGFNSAATRFGMRNGNGAAPAGQAQWDNLLVVP
jgi:hypothetical protein